jgi:MoaA/NifB/PqqE/SkfB family radical SAM enzyme
MKKLYSDHFLSVLSHLYINPLEKCNLRCKICYTRKTDFILSKKEILEFIDKYGKKQRLQTITFCGGEVFALSYFPDLINTLTKKNIFIQIITNGTIDKLGKFLSPNLLNIIVSLDGLPTYHDSNRGKGNFEKSLKFIQKAQSLGFHTEVFSIVTKQNYDAITDFEKYLKDKLDKNISITYHPRKPLSYLDNHPISNIKGVSTDFDFLNPEKIKFLLNNKKSFPSRTLGCFQISLMSDGKVYGCCEGTTPIGKISDDIEIIINNLKMNLNNWEKKYNIKNCLGCAYPDFVCGMKDIVFCNQ